MSETKITRNEVDNPDGWTPAPACSYSAAGAILFAPGLITGKISVGMKIKLTNNSTVKYYTVTLIATDGGSNNIVYLSGPVALVNSAITLPYYSMYDTPYGFPSSESLSGAKVYNSVAQTIGTSSIVTLTFDTEIFDTGGYHSTTTNTGRFTISQPGYYLLVGHAIFSTASGIVNTWFQLNGVSGSRYGFNGCNNSTTNNTGPCSSDILYLNTGDYVEMVCFQNSGGNITAIPSTTGNTTFAISRIGL